ncbi:type IV toxin-antitoxin system AbiEi family antitoxin [Agromyces sp. SYSU T00266]|uniref:type IV toxin-antitoxin system AbiEi family antitoxin n=1 Tax=Agromyces zhanjiangensis TaxID=3158562 RepID=UPI00339AFE73
MARLPSVLDHDDLPLAELCAARLDGEVMRIGGGWAPVDEPDLPSLRAAAVAPGLPSPFVIERRSAAWVHGAVPTPPPIAECCVPHSARVSMRSLPHAMLLREVAIAPADIVVIGGVRCTTPDRTIYDLVRDAEPVAGVVAIVAALLGADACAAERVRSRLELAHRLPHKAAALARLAAAEATAAAAAADQPSLTR